MAKQTKTSTKSSTSSSSAPSTPVVEAAKVAATLAAEQVQKSVSRSKREQSSVTVSVVADAMASSSSSSSSAEVDASTSASAEVSTTVRKQRRQVTREDLEQQFDSLMALLDAEVVQLRGEDGKKVRPVGQRFLRSVLKQVKQLRTDSLRVSSRRVRRQNAPRSTNSGFMKPVKISREMQKFTNMRDDQLVSRVDVTKAICQYVKNNNLQNQSDRRQFTPDEKLGKLLGTSEPLTYYNLQKHIQHHFVKS
jgi:chromatin remodeling complex protein RSC6